MSSLARAAESSLKVEEDGWMSMRFVEMREAVGSSGSAASFREGEKASKASSANESMIIPDGAR